MDDALAKAGFEHWKANSVLNITLVDDYLNKYKIRGRAPSDYMGEFKKNTGLAATMRTHLIDDIADYGIWHDDYVRFIECRGQRVLEELQKRLEPQL